MARSAGASWTMAEQATAAIRDIDRDALHILPLSIVPLQTPALSRARMIKNVRLESVVELFQDDVAGSGQIDIEDLPREFRWPELPTHPDLLVLRKLALLSSFDVYSLRVQLRQHGIPVNDYSTLQLSKRKNEELTQYMTRFTRPLIKQIYGDNDVAVQKFEDLVALFRDPDIKKALEKLKIMAARLEIRVDQVPKFLEDYGDIFLSLSYYQQALDDIQPIIKEFRGSLEVLHNNWQMRKDKNLMKTCETMEAILARVMAGLDERFEEFDRSTDNLWSQVSAERFRAVQKLVSGYHTTIGGILCALTVKMEAWARLFPTRDAGGPVKRADFLLSEMRPGFEKIQRIEDTAPTLPKLT